MDYNEIMGKVKAKQFVPVDKITGEQMFMLMRDQVINNVRAFGTLYEINMIPIDYYPASCIIINDNTCPTFRECEKIINKMLQYYKNQQSINIELENEWFHIEIDILETEE